MGRVAGLPTAAITNDSALGGQIIDGSLTFNKVSENDGSYLTRTPSTGGSRNRFTLSVWLKRNGNLGSWQRIIAASPGGNDISALAFRGDGNTDGLRIQMQYSGVNKHWSSSGKFRDSSGWYHIVMAVHLYGSSGERVRIYINGERDYGSWTTGSEPDSSNQYYFNNSGTEHRIGSSQSYPTAIDAYMSQLYWLDGLDATADDFGYTDSQTGIWRPKKYSGTFGTLGYYLPFDGKEPVGKDMSGNGHDWTPIKLRATTTLDKATGGLPILNTNVAGTVSLPYPRTDPLASNCVLACPFSNSGAGLIGEDLSYLINGSSNQKGLSNTGSVTHTGSYGNFYGKGGAIYLQNAQGQRVEIAASDDFNMGTGDFCIECWIYPTSASAVDGSLFVTHNNSTYFAFNYSPNTASFNIYLSASAVNVPAPQVEYTEWNHVALVRHGNVVKVYVNGLAVGSINHTGSVGYPAASTSLCRVGGGGSGALNSYIQDLRIYKGVAKYTENFLCGSGKPAIVPDSPSGVAVARKLDPIVSGSVGFDGLTSYLSAPNHSDFQLTNQDFCVEFWIYPIATKGSSFGCIVSKGFSFQIYYRDNGNSDRMVVYMATAGSGSYDIVDDFNSQNSSVPKHQWTHVALTRTSGTLKWFINGVMKTSTSASATVHSNTDPVTIGTYGPSNTSYEFVGHISNLRYIVGESVYSSNAGFTPTKEPLTLTSQSVTSSNVKLLCCKDKNDETAADKIPTGSITRYNNAYAHNFSPFNNDTINDGGGNYCTLNRLSRNGTSSSDMNMLAISHGNLEFIVDDSGVAEHTFGTMSVNGGKFYFEVLIEYAPNTPGTTSIRIGIVRNYNHSDSMVIYNGTGRFETQGTTDDTNYSEREYTTGNLIGVAVDCVNGSIQYYRDGVRVGVKSFTIGTGVWHPYIRLYRNQSGDPASYGLANFGQRPFIITPPEGFLSLCSNNLPHNQKIINTRKFHQTFQYTGNGGTPRTITGLNFKPDLIWQKSMSGGYHNRIWDSVRGWQGSLFVNQVNQENNYYDYGQVLDIGPGHVTYGQGNHTNNLININGHNYINWCWKAGTPQVPTSGSVYFDGNNDYLTVPKSTDLDFPGEFTMEGWILANSLPTGSNENKTIFESIDWNSQLGQYHFGVSDDNKVQFYVFNNANTYIKGTTTLTPRRWYHLAVSRDSSSNIRVFVNGVLENTVNNNYALSNSNQPNPARIGACKIANPGAGVHRSLHGYISNVRVIKGTALYTSNFTPSTTPLTNVTNTKLLCCQSTTSATTAAVSPTSISTNGNAEADISQNPFDAFSVDGIGYSTAATATAATTSNLTAGNITLSKASVNTESGFSILMYTGSGGQGNLPHGLEQDPDFIVVKGINHNNSYWQSYHSSFGTGSTVNRVYWNQDTSSDPSNTNIFKVNTGAGTILLNTGDHFFNSTSYQYIMYCWHSVPGYSDFGQYYGNGSAVGKYVHTGFRPAYIMIKRTSNTGPGAANYWECRDIVRDPDNPATSRLFANTGDTPSVGEELDFLANGFKIRAATTGSNADGATYLYYAFAEQPLVTPFGTSSNAR